MVTQRWEIHEGLRVSPDGAWRVGEFQVIHPPTLRYLKSHLVEEDGAPFVVDGAQRMPIAVEGPPFEVVRLVLDEGAGTAAVVLDDGSTEAVRDTSLGMNEQSGRFECVVRGGRFRARLSRAAHQRLLDNVVEEDGAFFLGVGPRRIPLRT
ncbi:MAG TPA: hypothetical protein VMR21_04255 [Vicinamibacteria bacterium]|nr:hypothetical protein [Vicinamibacteria bacterium]